METPDFEGIKERLHNYSSNLLENHQVGSSKTILSLAELITVIAWSAKKQEEQTHETLELSSEVRALKDNLKTYSESAEAESLRMRSLSAVVGIVACLQLLVGWWQYELGRSQIDWAHSQYVGQNAALEYQKMHDDRIEQRDNSWRRQDLEFEGRLENVASSTNL
jgi:hypothetical protein